MRNKKQPSVLIIIVSYNSSGFVKDCLRTLKRLAYKNYKVTIIDNGSGGQDKKKLKAAVKQSGIKMKLAFNRENRGFAGANNQAIRANPGFDYYFLLNPDTLLRDRQCLAKLVNFAQNTPNCGIVGPKLTWADGKIQKFYGQLKIIGFSPINGSRIEEVDWVQGAAFLVKNEVIEKIGYFDSIFNPAYYEETDYCLRAKKFGFKVFYYPKTAVVHLINMKSGKGDPLRWVKLRNKLIFIFINYSLAWLIPRLFWEAGVTLKHVLNGEGGQVARVFAQIYSLRKKIVAKRKSIYRDFDG